MITKVNRRPKDSISDIGLNRVSESGVFELSVTPSKSDALNWFLGGADFRKA